MTRPYRFEWLDVFTRTPLEGNQLAVFPNAHGLSADEMLRIARETHLSETTFVFPREADRDRVEGYPTRIFATFGEMPFAGHPTLGTAFVLADRTGADEIGLKLPVGRIPVTFRTKDGARFGEMQQNEPEFGSTHEVPALARALGVEPDDLDRSVPAQTVSTGIPFGIVPFRSLETLQTLRPAWSQLDDYLRGTDAKFLYLITRQAVDASAGLHARMIFAGGDDPATGSAAGPAAAWMVRHGWARPDATVLIEQGLEAHRRSHLFVAAGVQDGRPTRVRVGGYCVRSIAGELELP